MEDGCLLVKQIFWVNLFPLPFTLWKDVQRMLGCQRTSLPAFISHVHLKLTQGYFVDLMLWWSSGITGAFPVSQDCRVVYDWVAIIYPDSCRKNYLWLLQQGASKWEILANTFTVLLWDNEEYKKKEFKKNQDF